MFDWNHVRQINNLELCDRNQINKNAYVLNGECGLRFVRVCVLCIFVKISLSAKFIVSWSLRWLKTPHKMWYSLFWLFCKQIGKCAECVIFLGIWIYICILYIMQQQWSIADGAPAHHNENPKQILDQYTEMNIYVLHYSYRTNWKNVLCFSFDASIFIKGKRISRIVEILHLMVKDRTCSKNWGLHSIYRKKLSYNSEWNFKRIHRHRPSRERQAT